MPDLETASEFQMERDRLIINGLGMQPEEIAESLQKLFNITSTTEEVINLFNLYEWNLVDEDKKPAFEEFFERAFGFIRDENDLHKTLCQFSTVDRSSERDVKMFKKKLSFETSLVGLQNIFVSLCATSSMYEHEKCEPFFKAIFQRAREISTSNASHSSSSFWIELDKHYPCDPTLP